MAFEDHFHQGPPYEVGSGPVSRIHAAVAHLSVVCGAFIPFAGCVAIPLLVTYTRGHRDRGLTREATEALNLGINFAVAMLIARYVEVGMGILTDPTKTGPFEAFVSIPFVLLAMWGSILTLSHRMRFGSPKNFYYPFLWRPVVDPEVRQRRIDMLQKRRERSWLFGRRA